MTMEADGQKVHWGKAEKWIATGIGSLLGLLFAAVLGLMTYFGTQMTKRMDTQNAAIDKQSEDIQAVKTEQAVQGGTLTTLTTQLADVPRLTRDMAEMKVRVERLEQDSRDNRR